MNKVWVHLNHDFSFISTQRGNFFSEGNFIFAFQFFSLFCRRKKTQKKNSLLLSPLFTNDLCRQQGLFIYVIFGLKLTRVNYYIHDEGEFLNDNNRVTTQVVNVVVKLFEQMRV